MTSLVVVTDALPSAGEVPSGSGSAPASSGHEHTPTSPPLTPAAASVTTPLAAPASPHIAVTGSTSSPPSMMDYVSLKLASGKAALSARVERIERSLSASWKEFKEASHHTAPVTPKKQMPRARMLRHQASVTYRPPLDEESQIGSSHHQPLSSARDDVTHVGSDNKQHGGLGLGEIGDEEAYDDAEYDEDAAQAGGVEVDECEMWDHHKEEHYSVSGEKSETSLNEITVTQLKEQQMAVISNISQQQTAAEMESSEVASQETSVTASCVRFHLESRLSVETCEDGSSNLLPSALDIKLPSGRTPRVSKTTGFLVAPCSSELFDSTWADMEAPYAIGCVPRAPHRTCECWFPLRSLTHLWKHHVQPVELARNVEFEGGMYEGWRGQFYPNGEPKAVLRGVSHEIALFAMIIYGAFLFAYVSSGPGWAAAVVQVASAIFLFATSSQFHRRIWNLRTYNRLKRLDHSAIFVLAAGSSTPSAILIIREGSEGIMIAGWILLGWAWLTALTGVAYSWWKPLSGRVPLFGLVWMGVSGACMVPFVYCCYVVMLPMEFALTITAWLVYLAAIVTYSTKKGDFWPSVWGYHECFHALTIVGSVCTCVFNWSICVRVS